jgi:hypothetical protein
MGKNFEGGNDISPDVASNVGSDTGADYGGDLAGDAGVDLNAGGANGGVAKATIMSYEAPPPENYTNVAMRSPDYAEVTEAPANVGRTPEQFVEQQGYRIVSPETEDSKPAGEQTANNLFDEARFLEGERRRETERQMEAANAASREPEYADSPPDEQD